MNKGIDISSGEYLIFINAGDCFYNKDVLKDVCSDLNNDIVVGRVNLTYPDSLNKVPKIRRIDR